MNVYAIPAVIEYFNELVDILYEKGYFSYTVTSEIYAAELFDDNYQPSRKTTQTSTTILRQIRKRHVLRLIYKKQTYYMVRFFQ